MKNMIRNTLSLTALTLLVLSLIATVMGGSVLFIATVFQHLLVNAVIQAGLYLLSRLECRFALVESLVEIGFVLVAITAAGALFGWFASTPLWVVLPMGVGVYLASCCIDILRLNDDLKYINNALKNREALQTGEK